MASTSATLNKPLREHVAPRLREAGFQHVDARNAWSWRADCICVFNVRVVGSSFSSVTGWPPGSAGAWLGVFFTFGPRPPNIKVDRQGRLRPAEHLCHLRSHLDRRVDQSSRTRNLTNPQERKRKDIWWVDPDGANAEEVASDIATAVSEQALPWFAHASDLESALALVETMHDCFAKFTKAALLARRLGRDELWRKYDGLAEAEALRIGASADRGSWYGI